MAETKFERAIRAYREAADAYEDLPVNLRRHGLFGPLLPVQNLRDEANWLEELQRSVLSGTEPASPRDLPG